jgi:hypothetical protein
MRMSLEEIFLSLTTEEADATAPAGGDTQFDAMSGGGEHPNG